MLSRVIAKNVGDVFLRHSLDISSTLNTHIQALAPLWTQKSGALFPCRLRLPSVPCSGPVSLRRLGRDVSPQNRVSNKAAAETEFSAFPLLNLHLSWYGRFLSK